jgi:hypothetical protein
VKARRLDFFGIMDDVPADYDPFDLRELDLVRRHTPTDGLDE